MSTGLITIGGICLQSVRSDRPLSVQSYPRVHRVWSLEMGSVCTYHALNALQYSTSHGLDNTLQCTLPNHRPLLDANETGLVEWIGIDRTEVATLRRVDSDASIVSSELPEYPYGNCEGR